MQYMLTSKEEEIAKEWKKYEGYTVRPVNSIVEYYRHVVTSHPYLNNYVMYGGTPEVRSIFQELEKPITMIDKSDVMIKAMGRLTKSEQGLADNEQFIKIDWLEPDFPNLHADLIIGDDAINMVCCKQFHRFLENSHRMLKPGGLFVCHLLIKPHDNLINKTFSDLQKEYKNGVIKSKYDLASRLNFICYDKNTYAMGWQQTIETIGKQRLDLFKSAFDFTDIFGFCNSRFYCPPQELFECLVKKYFDVLEVFYAHEHDYCLYEPVYLLKKKETK